MGSLASGVLTGRGLSRGDLFALQGSLVERALCLGLVPGLAAFQLWPRGKSLNYLLSQLAWLARV